MLGLRLSVPMALGRTRWHHTFPCKFIKRGQKRLQIPGLRDSNSSGLARRTNAKARLGEGVSWTSSFVRGRLVGKQMGLCGKLSVATFYMFFTGGQITKERRDRFLGERLELLLDACLSARALSKLVMNSRSSESQLALDSSETPLPYDVPQLRNERDVFGFVLQRHQAFFGCVNPRMEISQHQPARLGHAQVPNLEWRSMLSKMSFVTCRDSSSDWISTSFNIFQPLSVA